MARRHGSTGEVAIDPTGASTYVPVAALNSWTLDSARDKVDVTSFGDVNKQYVVGLPDTKGTFSGFWDELSTPDTVFAVAGADVPCGLKLTPSPIPPTYFAAGLAYLDASIDVKADGAVTIAGEWVAAGAWTWEPAGALLGLGTRKPAAAARRREGDAEAPPA
jgi:hypothetical protein